MKFFCLCLCAILFSKCETAEQTQNILPENTTSISITSGTSTTRKPAFQGPARSPCSCEDGQCGCCTGTILDRFKQKLCGNFTYEPDDFAFTAAMSLNGRVLYKNTVTGKNPRPMCVRVPRFQFINFCMRFYNIYFANRNMHLCLDMEANWEDLTLVEWSFDCFRMGSGGFAVVGPEDGGGFPASPVDEEEQTDEDYDDSARNIPYKAIGTNTVIFDMNLRKAQTGMPDKMSINIKTLENGDSLISYQNRRE